MKFLYKNIQFDIVGFHLKIAATLSNQRGPLLYGMPKAIRSDNGSELLAGALQEQMKRYRIKLANIEPGKP